MGGAASGHLTRSTSSASAAGIVASAFGLPCPPPHPWFALAGRSAGSERVSALRIRSPRPGVMHRAGPSSPRLYGRFVPEVCGGRAAWAHSGATRRRARQDSHATTADRCRPPAVTPTTLAPSYGQPARMRAHARAGSRRPRAQQRRPLRGGPGLLPGHDLSRLGVTRLPAIVLTVAATCPLTSASSRRGKRYRVK